MSDQSQDNSDSNSVALPNHFGTSAQHPEVKRHYEWQVWELKSDVLLHSLQSGFVLQSFVSLMFTK